MSDEITAEAVLEALLATTDLRAAPESVKDQIREVIRTKHATGRDMNEAVRRIAAKDRKIVELEKVLAKKDAEMERLRESRDNWKQGYEAQETARARWVEQLQGLEQERPTPHSRDADDAYVSGWNAALAAAAKEVTDAR